GPTLMENMPDLGVFTFYHSKDPALPGALFLGGSRPPADKVAPGARIRWFPLVSSTHWDLGAIDLVVNGRRLGVCTREEGSPCHLLVDTGTSDISFPSDVFDIVSDALNVRAGCSNYDSLPMLTYIVRGEDEYGKETEVEVDVSPAEYALRYDGFCDIDISARDVNSNRGPLWIVGSPFLQAYMTTFDRDNHRIGIVRSQHSHSESLISGTSY
ncbi:hypothetical protein FOZ63_014693, partial [Perkinsus olseni]